MLTRWSQSLLLRHAPRWVSLRTRKRIPELDHLYSQLQTVTPRPFVAEMVVWVSLAMFLARSLDVFGLGLVGDDALLAYGSSTGRSALVEHQWWRLLTDCFVHENHEHLLLNITMLLVLGRTTEQILGPAVTLCVFFMAQTIPTVAIWCAYPEILSFGASAGILGIIAASTVVSFRIWRILPKYVSEEILYFPAVVCIGTVVHDTVMTAAFPVRPLITIVHTNSILVGAMAGFLLRSRLDGTNRRSPQRLTNSIKNPETRIRTKAKIIRQ